MSWQVIFQKRSDGNLDVMYVGDVNAYEFLGLIEVEREKLLELLKSKIRVNEDYG